MPIRRNHRLGHKKNRRQQQQHAKGSRRHGGWKRHGLHIVALILVVVHLTQRMVVVPWQELVGMASSVTELVSSSSSSSSSSAPTFGLALVHWREANITWPHEVPSDWNMNIYETGGQLLIPEHNISRPFQNAGSEECTAYLQYILDEYDHLPDISVFLQPDALLGFQKQDRVEAHSPFSSIQELHHVTAHRMAHLAQHNQNHNRTNPGAFLHYGDPYLRDGKFEALVAYDPMWHKDFLPWLFELVQVPYDKVTNRTKTHTRPSACFAVTKERILRHSQHVYQTIQDRIYELGRGGCFAMENSWHVLLGEDPWLPVESSLDDYYHDYLERGTYQRKDRSIAMEEEAT